MMDDGCQIQIFGRSVVKVHINAVIQTEDQYYVHAAMLYDVPTFKTKTYHSGINFVYLS